MSTAAVAERGALVDGPYRYWLTRVWNLELPQALWVMLNPSTADADQDDPTVRKCRGFTERFGYGGFTICNLYAYRATDPKDMMAAGRSGTDIVGPDNLQHICYRSDRADKTIVAWGASTPKDAAMHIHRVTKALLGAKQDLHCIGRTNSGAPRHPLIVGYDQPAEIFAAVEVGL